jgi:antitoxin (DNA-binding transcriptional repressor) of toxin-antitoxin stability system
MRVGVKELKNSLSRYLRLAKAGETVYVADRDEVIAELRPHRAARTTDEAALASLGEVGLVTRGSAELEDFAPIRMSGRGRRRKSLTEVVLEDRR